MKKTFKLSLLSLAVLSCSVAGNAQAQAWTPHYGTGPGVAIGSNTNAVEEGLSIGGEASVKIPTGSSETKNRGIAIGHGVIVDGYRAISVGASSAAHASGSIAIGSMSTAAREAQTYGTATGPVYFGDTAPENLDSYLWTSNQGVFSIGSNSGELSGWNAPSGNVSRQLTGLAAGSQDNDAVNVAQLKNLKAYGDASYATQSDLQGIQTNVQGLMSGSTKVSKIDLLSDPTDTSSPGIGLAYAAPVASASGTQTDPVGRLTYTQMVDDGNGGTTPTTRSVATLDDGFKIIASNPANPSRAAGDEQSVALNKGLTFEGDSYLQTSVATDNNGGAIVKLEASDLLKNTLAQLGVTPPVSDGSTGGSTGGSSVGQIASGNFSSKGITVAAGEGNQQITIGQNNVNMGGNRIQNVGDPIQAGDAANKAYVDRTARSLRNKINDVDKDLRAGVAMAIAVAGLPQAYMPGKSVVSLAGGTYHGQGGFALGLSHATDNRSWVFKGAASVDTRGNFGGSLSAGYQF